MSKFIFDELLLNILMSSELTPSDGKSPFGDPRGIAIPHEEYEESLFLFLEEWGIWGIKYYHW